MSDAVGTERISKVVGYKIEKGNFNEVSPNLPQRIAILAEANTANPGSLDTNAKQITSAQQAGNLDGFGAPIYEIMRILRPNQGSGIGGIPTIVYTQVAAGGSAANEQTIKPTGPATANGTHTINIAGRSGSDGVLYDINIVTGDTVVIVSEKSEDAIHTVLG